MPEVKNASEEPEDIEDISVEEDAAETCLLYTSDVYKRQGMETKTAVDSGVCVVARKAGTVLRSTSTDKMCIRDSRNTGSIFRRKTG